MKQTWRVAAHTSANDPKRTFDPARKLPAMRPFSRLNAWGLCDRIATISNIHRYWWPRSLRPGSAFPYSCEWGFPMRRLSIALVATVSAVAFTQVALAADMPVKAPVAPVAARYNWTGFYVGGNVGYSWATADNDLSISQQANPSLFATLSGTDSNKLKGVIGGVQAGYNWQFNPNWLLGVEADFQASGQKGTTGYGATIIIPSGLGNNPATVTDSHKLDWFGTVRGRLGVTSDRWLVYATGGL